MDFYELAGDTKAYILANEYANHNKRDREIRRLAMSLFRSDREWEVVVQRAGQWIAQMKDQATADQFLKDIKRSAPGEFKKTTPPPMTVSRLQTRPSASIVRPVAPWRPPGESKGSAEEVAKELPSWLDGGGESAPAAGGTGAAAAAGQGPEEAALQTPMRIVRGTNRATQFHVEVEQAAEKDPGGRVRPILLVEPDRAFRDACAASYRKAGYRVTSVGRGQAALHLLVDGNFLAVQIDMDLQDMDGLQFLRDAVGMGLNLRRTPVAVCSKSGPEQLAEFRNNDHVAFIPKPTDPAAVMAAIVAMGGKKA
jgi:CheY-like chemotaxis protein